MVGLFVVEAPGQWPFDQAGLAGLKDLVGSWRWTQCFVDFTRDSERLTMSASRGD